MNVVEAIEQKYLKTKLPSFKPGDTVQVHVRVKELEKAKAGKGKDKDKEKEKERIQLFEGVIIGMRGSGISSSFVVRKISFGVGVERIFPLHSPTIDKIKVLKQGRVRRAKLYYLRELSGKAAKIREKQHQTTAAATATAPEAAPTTPTTQA